MSFLPFTGEMMVCVMCGAMHRSDPGIESGWTCIVADGQPFYVCPDELPAGPASKEEFAAAYKKILIRILRKN